MKECYFAGLEYIAFEVTQVFKRKTIFYFNTAVFFNFYLLRYHLVAGSTRKSVINYIVKAIVSTRESTLYP